MTVSGLYLNLRYSTFTSFGGFATFLNLCRYVGCFQKNEYLIDKAFILFDINFLLSIAREKTSNLW